LNYKKGDSEALFTRISAEALYFGIVKFMHNKAAPIQINNEMTISG